MTMKNELSYYKVSPSVVLADAVTEVTVTAKEESFAFEDGRRYIIECTPASIPATPFPDGYKISDLLHNIAREEAVAEKGVLRFSHRFFGEQKWGLHIFPADQLPEPTGDEWIDYHATVAIGFRVQIYSLKEDLYTLRPYKGDLHLHTNRSDGTEAPEITAANYRKAGYDFISITDHHVFGGAEVANRVYQKLATRFVVYNGEEIHPDHMGQLHIVNFDSTSSVNERILGPERETVLREIEEIKNSAELADCFDKTDIAWRTWVYRAIQKSGGLAIFPHPYWTILGIDHASPEAIDYTFRHALMDAFEVHGGTSYTENNRQALLYHEMRAKGFDYPIVASTDCHCSRMVGEHLFGAAYTVAFAKSPKEVREAILNRYTVGVQSEHGHPENVTGSLRLATYAMFLIENYFPLHDELCQAAGLMMHRYAKGDQTAKAACETAETYIKHLEAEFFGA